ncbi:MAG TPA: diguanylate cyclase, partial [Beijerinckiaceae bacterium]|nr:diguanylate cyclase [Beijerinckiaceae bacterium]
MVVSISPFRAFLTSLPARGTLALCAAVAVAVIAAAMLGYNELRDGTARQISDRLDHSARAAGAAFESSRNLPLTARRSEGSRPVAFRIASGDGRQVLTPSADLDRLVEAAADVNQGDVHLFRFHAETGLFERIATSARGPGGEHVRTVHFGPQYPAYETLQQLRPFRGAVPQFDRFRLAEFIPVVDDREHLAGALAVDIGWLDEVWRPTWDLVHRQVLTLLVLLLGVAGLGVGLLLRAMQPLRLLSAYARRLARHEPVGAPPGLGRPDEIGDVSAGLAELVVMRDRLEHLAFTDPLTGFANRARLEVMIGQQLEGSHRTPPDAALLLFGVDNFRSLNDGFGFSVGDSLLREMAGRLQSLSPQGSLIARSGADEFAVLVPHCDSYAQMFDHARKLLAALRRPYAQAQGGVFASVSAGFAMLPASGGTAETVLRNATLALNRAKRQGRNRIEMFSPCFDEEAQRRADLERNLNRAINSGELLLHFQPLVRTSDRRLIGVEALVRWDHPQLG